MAPAGLSKPSTIERSASLDELPTAGVFIVEPEHLLPLHVRGTAICGEDARTAAWRATVADAARATALVDVAAVSLGFTVAPGRRVDVDNLARPALEGLRDAGWFRRGFPSLDRLRVTKAFGADVGLVVSVGDVTDDLLDVDFATSLTGVIPSEGAHEVKRAWRDTVAALWARPPIDGDVAVELAFNTRASIVGLLKANIDTLEPVLGRDPSGRLTFCPLDDNVTSLVARRTQGDAPALHVRVARMTRENAR